LPKVAFFFGSFFFARKKERTIRAKCNTKKKQYGETVKKGKQKQCKETVKVPGHLAFP
jgi:hypothetical protein